MKKFQFNLQRVLEFREAKVKQAQLEVAKALQAVEAIKEQQRYLEEKIVGASGNAFGDYERPIFSFNLQDQLGYLEALQGQLASLQEEQMRLQNELYAKRQALQKALKEKEGMENLKEKRLAEHKALVEKKETEFLDEMATLRHEASS